MSQRIDLGQLHPQQLVELKKSTEEEVTHFTSSLQALQTAQSKLKDCISSIDNMKSQQDKQLLVPLTSSLYLPGKVQDPEKFLVDIGTGYYVEKTSEDAKRVYTSKITKLNEDSAKLKEILVQKNEILNQLNMALRTKVLQMEKENAKPAA
ncbi:subunit of tubulin prefoldin [Yamadazyma tenuis]|uniref:Prefoldin alpha subunit n=1 Tax=Candida tenuis (strain ATCC 10573 / BCRC 21748 / CBS 615 / JCM 9827 / NBRC 10315 / NRRL Y-1498 / VKM Y-70) TaxID=590646 RepID=G3B8Y9_CANTC|nr:Prefoldin alpha subunit [Yamadazyma tenuis ATCC 10573]EGV61809.1 Prefoldin alpha subunit [Yamadazyma tenuis ATCC 10573]WEJ93035.1 subunit of tubulin prefoldin [Yamadazyma tenuis]